MIHRQAVLFWLALQLALATGAALTTLFGIAIGILSGLLAMPANVFVLQRAWRQREQIETNKPLSDGLAVAGLLAFLVLLFSTNLLSALCVLLVMIQLALGSITRTYRQYYLLQLVSFILLLTGAAEATSGSYLLVMMVYTLLSSFSLSEAWLDRDASSADIKGPGIRPRLHVAGKTILVAVIFYFLIPRLAPLNLGGYQSDSGDFYHNEQWQSEARESVAQSQEKQRKSDVERTTPEGYQELNDITDLSGFGSDQYQYSGFNESFDVRDNDRSGLVDLNAIVARMKASRGSYLKVRTFDTFDGIRWSSSSEDISRKLRTDGRGKVQLRPGKGEYQQVIEIVQPMTAWLPVAADPVTLWLPSSSVALDQYGHPLLPAPLSAGTRYTVLSSDERVDQRPVSYSAGPDSFDIQLPKPFDTRIHRLARQVTRSAHSPYQQAVALEQHLRTQYDYSFDSILQSQGRTPLDRFLFEDKRGHCEYFASAMTIMLRSLGIPARLITGFSANSQNPLTGYYEIRAIDGHAWTEAWIDGRWITFEPTAYYQMPRQQSSLFAGEQIQQYAEDVARRSQLANDEWSLIGLVNGLWMLIYSLLVILLAALKWLVLVSWPLWLLLAVLCVLGYWQRARWWPMAVARFSQWKLKRYQPNDAQSAQYYYLYHLQRIAMLHEIKRPSWQAADEWAQRLPSDALQQLVGAIGASLYEQADADLAQWQHWALLAAEQLLNTESIT